MRVLNELRAQRRMSWIEAQHGCGSPRRTTSWMRSLRMVSNSVSASRQRAESRRARDLTVITIDGESLRDHVFNGPEVDLYTDHGGES
jgi:hypothetical protein